MHSAALQTHRDPPRRAGFDAGLASLRRSGRGAARRRRVGSMSQPRARRRPASHLSEIVGQLPGSLEEVVFRCCLVNALPSEGSCTPPTSDGCSQGRRDSNSRCRVWSPVPWAAWRRPYVELWVVSGNEKAHRLPGGLTVGSSCTRDLSRYMRPTCLPPKATEFCSVHWRLTGLCAASSALCPAYTGSVISMELKDRMVRLSFVACPGWSEAFQNTHILGHVQAMCVERVRGCGLARSICVYAALSESASRGSRRTLRRLSAWRLRSGSQPVNRLLPCAFCAPYGEGSRCSMRGPRDNV